MTNAVILINNGANVNDLDNKRQTALHFAAQHGMISEKVYFVRWFKWKSDN